MSDTGEAKVDDQLRWRGINHLAMVTPDMDATVRFYHGVLGMRLVTTLKAGPMRHYFFEIGPLRLPLPEWLTPGAMTVTHVDLGGGEFRFTLDLVHPRFGTLIRQSAVFREVLS